MNILMILLLPMAAHGDLPCSQYLTNTTEIQMVVADRDSSNGHGAFPDGVGQAGQGLTQMGVLGKGKPTQANYAGKVAAAMPDDLLFYMASHAQAVGDTSGPTMTPWLELRPIGYVGHEVLQGTDERAPVNDEYACARSAAHTAAPGSASLRGGV